MKQPNPPIKFCPSCGTQNEISAQFCYTCGSQVPAAPATSVIQKQVKNQHTTLLLIVFVAAILGCGTLFLISATRSNKTVFSSDVRFDAPSVPQARRGVTFAQFERLQSGMSYSQAVAILGAPGTEISRIELAGTLTVMYKWDGENLGANMNAMFQNDRLISKAQYGLK